MKNFKELLVSINEAGEGSDTPDGGAYAKPDFGGNLPDHLYQIEKPGVLEQINGYVKMLGSKQYIEPRGAIIELRTKLNIIGLDFVFAANSVTEGVYEYPLTAFGGRWGWDMETGTIMSDDGITHRLGHGLTLKCEAVQTSNGLWMLQCEVAASLGGAPEQE